MSNTTVVSRRDMKEPDKFQSTAGRAAGWVAAHKKQVYGALVALAVAVVAVIVGSQVQASREEKAGVALFDVGTTMSGQVSSVPLPGQTGPRFADETARQTAIAAAAEKVRADHAGSAAGTTAALIAGDAQLRLGAWDKARAAYDAYLSSAERSDPLKFSALEGVALAEEGAGKLDAAAQAFERMAKEAPEHADRADLGRARVLAKAGKVDEARKLLSGFADAHKGSELAGDAAERLSKLGK